MRSQCAVNVFSASTFFAQMRTVTASIGKGLVVLSLLVASGFSQNTAADQVNKATSDVLNLYWTYLDQRYASIVKQVQDETTMQAFSNKTDVVAANLANTQNDLGAVKSDLDNLKQAVAKFQAFTDSQPCAALSPAVTMDSTGGFTISFQTQKSCTAWVQGIGGTNVARGCTGMQGTITQNFDPTLSTNFSYPLPAAAPSHGCLLIKMWTDGGTYSERSFVY